MANCKGCHQETKNGHCVACDINQMARNHYFTGKLLVERDFVEEQAFFLGADRRHNKYLHGWGTVCGLRVKQHPNPACRDRFVIVEPGVAVDCCGREIFVQREEVVDFKALFLDHWRELHGTETAPDDQPHRLQICLSYAECPTEQVPAFFDDCSCDDSASQPNRILHSYNLELRVDAPPADPNEGAGIDLDWSFTLNLARAAQLAIDETNGLLYVMTAEDPGDIYVYRTDNLSLVDSHALPARGWDMALSPDGTRLYVSLDAPDPVRVLDTAALGTGAALVNDLPMAGAGGADVRLAVSPAGDRLYVLLTAAANVVVWDSSINAPGAPAPLATLATGSAPSDLAVSPSGDRAFVANGGDGTLSIVDAAALTISSTALAGVSPAVLAVGATTAGERIYVGDRAANRVHIFDDALAPLGTPQNLGADTPVDLLPSPGGRWLYVLVDNAGEGHVLAIDAHALEQGMAGPGDSVEVGDGPAELLLADGGKRLYAAFSGDPAEDDAGGVAVVVVTQTDCAAIFETALDGCPTCGDDECMALATIADYVYDSDVTDDRLDNLTDRRLLPSVSLLADVVRCILSGELGGGEGPQGPPGLPGSGISTVDVNFVACTDPPGASFNPATETLTLDIPRGCDGEDGQDGQDGTDGTDGADGQSIETVNVNFVDCQTPASSSYDPTTGTLDLTIPSGCGPEQQLTHICTSNWKHAQGLPIGVLLNEGLLIGFDNKVQAAHINRHTFQLWVRLPRTDDQFGLCLDEWREVNLTQGDAYVGGAENVEVVFDPDTGLCTLEMLPGGPQPQPAGDVQVGWIRLNKSCQGLFQEFVSECRVVFKGDLVADVDGRSVDGNHLFPWLPNRPTGDGVEGGTMESYFFIGEGDIFDINRAGEEEFVRLPGIGPERARAIVSLREARGNFTSVDDLLEVSGIGPELLARLRPRLRA